MQSLLGAINSLVLVNQNISAATTELVEQGIGFKQQLDQLTLLVKPVRLMQQLLTHINVSTEDSLNELITISELVTGIQSKQTLYHTEDTLILLDISDNTANLDSLPGALVTVVADLDAIKTSTNSIDQNVKSVEENVINIDSTLKAQSAVLDTIDATLTTVDATLTEVAASLDLVEATVADIALDTLDISAAADLTAIATTGLAANFIVFQVEWALFYSCCVGLLPPIAGSGINVNVKSGFITIDNDVNSGYVQCVVKNTATEKVPVDATFPSSIAVTSTALDTLASVVNPIGPGAKTGPAFRTVPGRMLVGGWNPYPVSSTQGSQGVPIVRTDNQSVISSANVILEAIADTASTQLHTAVNNISVGIASVGVTPCVSSLPSFVVGSNNGDDPLPVFKSDSKGYYLDAALYNPATETTYTTLPIQDNLRAVTFTAPTSGAQFLIAPVMGVAGGTVHDPTNFEFIGTHSNSQHDVALLVSQEGTKENQD